MNIRGFLTPALMLTSFGALLHDKIRTLRAQMRRLDETQEQLKKVPDGQISTTDTDARSMNSQANGSGLVATTCRQRSMPKTISSWRTR